MERKKKILIAIYDLAAGGAQKSLVSLLNTISPEKYSIDLFLLNSQGLFLSQVPEYVNLIKGSSNFSLIHHSPAEFKYFFKLGIWLWMKVVYSRLISKCFFRNLHKEQAHWKTWSQNIENLPKEYDCAIGYVEGCMNYFVIDKVKAKRKILWIHNVYTALKYNPDFDFDFFSKADNVVTMSESGVESLQHTFPQLKQKFIVLENISNGKLIEKFSLSSIEENEYKNFKGLKLLSIGRLMDQKNYPLAIQAASELRKKGIVFLWYVIGEGFDRAKLEALIEKENLGKVFKLIGLRENPYQYMRVADMIVMTSKFEGRSIALDEAKILHKLIVTTNYTSVADVVENEKTGLICEMTPQAVADAITRLHSNPNLVDAIITNLKSKDWDNTSEVEKYYSVIEG